MFCGITERLAADTHLVRGQFEDKSVFALASGKAWREARFGGDVGTTGAIGTTPGGVERGTADAPQPEPQQWQLQRAQIRRRRHAAGNASPRQRTRASPASGFR